MAIKQHKRWLLLGAVAVLVGFAAVWATTRTPQEATETDEMSDMSSGGMEGTEMEGMGMGGDGTVRVDPELARALGVTSVNAALEPLSRTIRSTGRVTYDETRLSSVAPKIGGWVEELHVDFTGQVVRRGQPLLEIYSPELVSAQEELLSATRLQSHLRQSRAPGVADRSADLVEAARRRLVLWDISQDQIDSIEQSGEVRRTLTLHAPFSGFVVKRNVEAGQATEAGQTLYQLADLSTIWIDVDVYESDLRFVREGESAEVLIDAYPGERLSGRVAYIYPDVRADTRTARVRIELANPGERIKPGMFATVNLEAGVAERALVVPRDAVMRTGTRDLVFVEESPGTYKAREVTVGAEADGKTQILSGLLAGEKVIARANFLLDAESRLMETMMGQPATPGMEPGGDPDTSMDMNTDGMNMPDPER